MPIDRRVHFVAVNHVRRAAMASLILVASDSALCGFSTSSRSTANSSPPKRATKSVSRMHNLSRSAAAHSNCGRDCLTLHELRSRAFCIFELRRRQNAEGGPEVLRANAPLIDGHVRIDLGDVDAVDAGLNSDPLDHFRQRVFETGRAQKLLHAHRRGFEDGAPPMRGEDRKRIIELARLFGGLRPHLRLALPSHRAPPKGGTKRKVGGPRMQFL